MDANDIANSLASQLVIMGLRGGTKTFEEEEPRVQTRLLAKWPLAKGNSLEIRFYISKFFDTHDFWIGFGSSRPEPVLEIMNGIKRTAFVEILFSDTNEEFELVATHKRRALERASYTTFEDYSSVKHYWAWFGRYFRLAQKDIDVRAASFLSGVIQMYRDVSPPSPYFGATETKAQKTIRLRQDQFRKDVLNRSNGRKCTLTGCSIVPTLEAAHIVSWSTAETDRISPDNGLLLVASAHRLFDAGFMSFKDTGRILIKEFVDDSRLAPLSLNRKMKLSQELTPGQKRNMKKHRARHGFSD